MNAGTAFGRVLRILKWGLPGLYLAGAAAVYVTFRLAPPDGLANIGLVLWTFPFVLVGTFLLGLEFPYAPGGYYAAHTLYFWPAVILLAGTAFLVLHLMAAKLGRGPR
jgi:hypothetical protein